MNRKFIVAVALFITAISAWGQEYKIGYTSIDAIVFSMPEIPGINTQLQERQKQLGTMVDAKQQTYQLKYQEYAELAQNQATPPAKLKEKEAEVVQAQNDFQTFSAQADQSMASKQAELYNPVYTKVQNAIEEVRKEKGYALILNMRVGSGDGIILAGRDEDNITEAVFKKLGVPMPSEAERQAAENNAPTGNGN